MSASTHIPYFDRQVEYVPVSKVRYMNTAQMRELDHAILIEGAGGPIAVLISFESWGVLQELIQKHIRPILDRVIGEVE